MKKSAMCRTLNAKLIIEDDLMHVLDCANSGIPVLTYDKPWNQGILPNNATRVFDWRQVINEVGKFAK